MAELGGKRSFVIAAFVHAAAIACLYATRVPVARVESAPERPAAEVEIEEEAPPAPGPSVAGDVTGGHANVTGGNIQVAAGHMASKGAAAPVAEAPAEAPPAPTGGVTFGGPRITVDGPNPFLVTRGSAPTEKDEIADAERRVEAALRQPARDRERELGLGPEGPVLAALGEAASAGTAPVTGTAVFLAIANGAGDVVAIDVVSCDGSRSAWAGSATAALASLKGKKLRVPSSATRAEMRIEVKSEWKLPSGHDPGADVSVLGVPVKKGEGKDATKIEVLNPLPKIQKIAIDKDVEIPFVQWTVTVFGTNGDPADIGAGARRVVHTRLVSSKVM